MKSSGDQRKAIEELYNSGSISKEEYDEMLRILEPESKPDPKPDNKSILKPSENNTNKYLKILGAIVAIVLVGYGIKNFMGSKAEDELTLENEKAMSLAKMECDCEVTLLDEFLSELIHLNNRIENNQLKYRSEAREIYDELTEELNSKKETSTTCLDTEKSKSELFKKYPIGTKKYNRLDSIYLVYLNAEKENETGIYHGLQEELKLETARYEKLLEEKLGYESEDQKNEEVSRVESLLNNFFYYYNQSSYNSLSNSIFNYINLPFHYKGQSGLDAERITNVFTNERYECSSCYYSVVSSTADYKGKDGELLIWRCRVNIGEYQSYDAIVKLKGDKISYFEFVNF